MGRNRLLAWGLVLAAVCLASCVGREDGADPIEEGPRRDAGQLSRSAESGVDGSVDADVPRARGALAPTVRPRDEDLQRPRDMLALGLRARGLGVFPLAAAGAPADGSIGTATLGGSAPSSYSVTLAFTGAIDNTPTASRPIGGVKVAYTKNGPTPSVGCVGGAGETVTTIAVGSISGYSAVTGNGTVTLSSLGAGSYLFRVCAYDSSTPAWIADGAVSSTVYATTVPANGSITSAVVSGGTNLTLAVTGMTDVDNLALQGVKVSYLTNGGSPAANCTALAGETVVTIPVGSISGYNSASGVGSVTLSGLGSATYRLRICAIDGTNTSLVATGTTRTATLPVAKPSDGTLTASFSGSGPSSYTVTLNLSGFIADDSGISGVRVSYTSDGSTPGIGCTNLGTETVSTTTIGSIAGYNAGAGTGTVTRSSLSARNYKFRVCGIDANDGTVIADGSTTNISVTTVPASGSINTAVVSAGTTLTLSLSGMIDPDNLAIDSVKVAYLTNGNTPAANCTALAGETVSTIPVASITGYNSGSGAGSIALTGLSPATYRLRVCAVDATNTALVASGATNIASLPVVKPADGAITASVSGWGPSSYTITLNLGGFTADDMGIASVRVSYTMDGTDPAVGCVVSGTETVSTTPRASISSYNSTTGVGSVTRSGLSAKNYKFRVCGVDANDSSIVADGSVTTIAATTVPANGSISSAVVGGGGTSLTVGFTGMNDWDNVAIDSVKVSYTSDGSTPAANCTAGGGATVVSIPVASIGSYNTGSGSGTVTLSGLANATYRVRVCAVDATTTSLVASGATVTVSLPVVKPTTGTITGVTVGGSAPYSYSVTLNLSGFFADDTGISRVRVSYTTDGSDPGVGCTNAGTETTSSSSTGTIGYDLVTGSGTVTRSGLSARNYKFRVCGVDANDTSVMGDGATTSVSVTTSPVTGSITSSVVSGASSLVVSFTGMTDPDALALNGVKVSYLSNGSTPAANCVQSGGETVVTIPAAFINSYNSGSGSGSVTVTGLNAATYKVRVCPIDATNTLLVGAGATNTVSLPVVKPANGSISTATASGSGPSSYSVTFALSGFTADDLGISAIKVSHTTNGVTPGANCTSAAGETVATIPLASVTGYNATTGVGTIVRSGLSAAGYRFRFCGVDANDAAVTGDGSTVSVTVPVVKTANGSLTLREVSGVSAGAYTATLALSGFTADDLGIGGVRVRVNTGSIVPALGCATAGTFSGGSADLGTTGAGVYPANFSPSTGVGTLDVPGLTIPSGLSATYAIRVCGVEANSNSVVADGSTVIVTVRTDTTPPGNGVIDPAQIVVDAAGVATVPLISGFTDDREVTKLTVRVNSGTTAPAANCTTAGTAGLDLVLTGATLPVLDANGAGTITIPGLNPSNKGTAYTIRVCAGDSAGNVAVGATAKVAAKTGGSSAPNARTFAALTSAASEVVHAMTNVTTGAVGYAAGKLTVQCPNPLAVAALSDAELGTFTATVPPFTPKASCKAEPAVVCAGPRCTATTSGVTDPCPTAAKKLALAVSCTVAAAVDAPDELVAKLVQDSTTSTPASLTLTCPNPADVITAIEADYGNPTLDETTLTVNTACTASVDPTYDDTMDALEAACVGSHSCIVPEGLSSSPLTPGSSGTPACPSRASTAAVITCGGSYVASTSVMLQVTGTGGTHICISNYPLTSEGTGPIAAGPCNGSTWRELSSIDAALAAGTYPWTLVNGDGLKTVYIKYRDAAFNESAVMTRQIQLDTVAPRRKPLVAEPNGPGVTSAEGSPLSNVVHWSAFAETGSGIASYKLVYTTDGSFPPTDCSGTYPSVVEIDDWEASTSGSKAVPPNADSPFVHDVEYDATGATSQALTGGTKYNYRVCATDRVSRSSTLAINTADASLTSGTATAFIDATYAPGALGGAVATESYTTPTLTGSFTMQDRDGPITGNWTNSIYVDVVTDDLIYDSSDDNELAEYCFSASPDPASCTEAMWHSVSGIQDLDGAGPGTAQGLPGAAKLSTVDGIKKMYAHARDEFQNASEKPATINASIKLDRTAPTIPTLTLAPGMDKMTVSWGTASDAGSGIAPYTNDAVPYKVVFNKSSSEKTTVAAPLNCSSGSQLELESESEATDRKVVQGTGGGGLLDASALNTGYTYAYRLCVTDLAGNMNAGVVKTAKPL